MLASALERQRSTIRELRDLSFALEPVVLRDQGFGPALEALTEQIGATHSLRIDLSIDEAESLGETAQVALYTIIRELLDQAVRRGPPTRIEVRIAHDRTTAASRRSSSTTPSPSAGGDRSSRSSNA